MLGNCLHCGQSGGSCNCNACGKCYKPHALCCCNENETDDDRIRWCREAEPTDKLNPTMKVSLCNLNTTNNMFFEKRARGLAGRCILDELTFEQLQNLLSKNPNAEVHLRKITNDPCVLQLANQTGLVVPENIQNMEIQRRISSSIPIYTLYKGSSMGKGYK